MTLIKALQANIMFDMDYRTGSLRDAVSGVVGTPTLPMAWKSGHRQRGLCFRLTGCVEYPDSAGNRMDFTEMTWIGLLRKSIASPTGAFTNLMAKESGAGIGWSIYRSNTNMALANDTGPLGVAYLAAASFKGTRLFGITLVNGGIAKGYGDGVYRGDFSGATTITGYNYPLHVGNDLSGLLPSVSGICRVMGFYKALSQAEMAQLHKEISTTISPVRAYVRDALIRPAPTPKSEESILQLYWALDGSPGGVELDRSGRGRNGTATGTTKRAGLFGTEATALVGKLTSTVSRTNGMTETIASNDQHVISMWCNLETLANTPILFSNPAGNVYAYVSTPTNLLWCAYGNANYTLPAGLAGRYHHFVFQKTGTTTGNVYLDGEKLVLASGALGAMQAAPGDFRVGISVASDAICAKGAFQEVKLYSANLSLSRIKQLYFEGAKRLRFGMRMRGDTEVTLSNLTAAGARIGNTPFLVLGGGTWRLSELRPNEKYIVSAGVQYLTAGADSSGAFGTWVWKYYHPAGVGSEGGHVMFCGNGPTDITSATMAGYEVRATGTAVYLSKCAPGPTFTTLAAHIAVLDRATYYSFAVTRSTAGVFTIYIKGGTFLEWTKMPTTAGANPSAADLTYTTSTKMVVASQVDSSGPGFGAVDRHEGVLTLQQLKEMYP